MSYCRFLEADVYVFASRDGIECCGCALQEHKIIDAPERKFWPYLLVPTVEVQNVFRTTQGMIDHLEAHRAKGHDVPDFVFADLRADEAENDATYALPPAQPKGEK